MYCLHNPNCSNYPRGLWLYLLLWNYLHYLPHYYVPGFSLHHCFGMSPRCLVEKVKAIAVTASPSESLWGLPFVLHDLVTVSTAVTNTMAEGILGRKAFVSLHCLLSLLYCHIGPLAHNGGTTHNGLPPHQSLIKNVLCRLTCRHSDIDNFSIESPLPRYI